MYEYKTAEATKTNLQDILNTHATKGWALFTVMPITSSFVVVFERAKTKHVEALEGAVDELQTAIAPLLNLNKK